MLGYHQSNQNHYDEMSSYLLASMSGRGHQDIRNFGGLHGAGFPVEHELYHGCSYLNDNDPGVLPQKLLTKATIAPDQRSDAGRLRSAKETTDKQDDDDRIRWQRPTVVGGYVSHREQWL